MSDYPATLHVNAFSNERRVLKFSYQFSQNTNENCEITGPILGGKLVIQVQAMDGDLDLFNWKLKHGKKESGYISIKSQTGDEEASRIEFEDAFCTEYTESYVEGVGHNEELVLSCRTIKQKSVSFTNKWAKA